MERYGQEEDVEGKETLEYGGKIKEVGWLILFNGISTSFAYYLMLKSKYCFT